MHLYISTYLHNLSLQFAAYLPTYNAKTSIFVCSDGGTSLEREREDGFDAIFFDFFNHLSPQESVWNWFRTGLKSTLISNQFGEGFDQIDMPITKMFDIIDFMIG